MKKRWLSLFLCLVMLLSVVLTGCGEKDDAEALAGISDDASESALTLTMWIVSEDTVTPEAYARISHAINSITKAKFKTQLVLRFFTEDEYREKLEEAIVNFKGSAGGTETTQPDEYIKDDSGLSVIKYPEVLANQVDIVYITGQDMYFDFIKNEWLSPLDSELSSSAKTIKEYVSSTLLSAAKYNGATYAIPNNNPIGEYTYMLLNKELMKEYAQDAFVRTGRIEGLFDDDLYPFLNLIQKKEGDTVIPIDSNYEECLNFLAYYWNISSDDYKLSELQKFSLFGCRYENIDELSRGSVILGYNSLFTDPEFSEDYLKLNEFRFREYLRKENDTRTKSAVKFMKGDSTILNKKDSEGDTCYTDENGVEYYPIIVGYPTATADDIYGNMFGVYTKTRSVERSMDIIAYLNTNATFRNILAYGVEGVDYTLTKDENGNFLGINKLDSGYDMDVWKTGNTFIAYPDTASGLDINIWENGKVQNRDSLVSPMLGFDFADFAKSTAPAANEDTVDPVNGFNLSYTTGHSKDVISQNATLAAWIKRCDEAGKGIYILQTKSVEEKGERYNYYVYNNDLEGKAVRVLVSGEPEKDLDETGKETVVAANVTLEYQVSKKITSYTPGYEISCISLFAKKGLTSSVSIVMENAPDVVEKDAGELITLDLNKTEDCTVEVHGPLYKTDLERTLEFKKWFPAYASGMVGTHILEYRNGDEIVYAIYRTITKVTDLDICLTGQGKDVVLNLVFNEQSGKLKENEYYMLYCVKVKLNSDDVNIRCVQTVNGEDSAFDSVTKDIALDIDFLGQLDVGLLKFSEKLNAELIALLDACYADGMAKIRAAKTSDEKEAAIEAAMDAYAALMEDIGKLLDAESYDFEESPTYDATNYPVLAPLFNMPAVMGVNKDIFLENIKALTSHEIVKKPDVKTQIGTMVPPVGERDEAYEYRAAYSPYVVYYEWLKAFGFLPKK